MTYFSTEARQRQQPRINESCSKKKNKEIMTATCLSSCLPTNMRFPFVVILVLCAFFFYILGGHVLWFHPLLLVFVSISPPCPEHTCPLFALCVSGLCFSLTAYDYWFVLVTKSFVVELCSLLTILFTDILTFMNQIQHMSSKHRFSKTGQAPQGKHLPQVYLLSCFSFLCWKSAFSSFREVCWCVWHHFLYLIAETLFVEVCCLCICSFHFYFYYLKLFSPIVKWLIKVQLLMTGVHLTFAFFPFLTSVKLITATCRVNIWNKKSFGAHFLNHTFKHILSLHLLVLQKAMEDYF